MNNKSFMIDNYNNKSCFSSFFPGIAGVEGIPIWVFYVNRGQAIAGFGIENKENSIMSFRPADQAYSETPLRGFRTFLKIDGKIYEPFSTINDNKKISNIMSVKRNYLKIEETNKELNIKVVIEYTTLPKENFGGLIRRVSIKNLNENEDRNIEIIDGIPEIIPYGVSNTVYKEMGYTARAWMEVMNIENKIPYYKTRTSLKDSESVEETKGGYYFISTSDNEMLNKIYDVEVIFGNNVDLQKPEKFYEKSIEEISKEKQNSVNMLSSAFSVLSKEIKSNGEIIINTIIGFCEDISEINDNRYKFISDEYYINKINESENVVEEIVNNIDTKTSNKLFDEYVKQNYLDNILRGGLPLVFGDDENKTIYHIYSRKHGDLERDYNFFSLEAKKYSQGNGNFRDVLQNRRSDIIFNPKIEDFNIRMFFNLIQLDGGNPLVVKGLNFKLKEKFISKIMHLFNDLDEDKMNKLKNMILKKFTPGSLLSDLRVNNIKFSVSEKELLGEVLKVSDIYEESEYGEGYWIDHWTYLMDILETYLEIYPEKEKELFFGFNDYKYYDSYSIIRSRKEKYKLKNNTVLQLDSILEDEEKENLMNSRGHKYVTTDKGEIYTTNLFEKTISLLTMKFLNLDPFGMGISMDSNKPGWNDALNGLPSLFGSGMSETFELSRLINYVLTLKNICDENIEIHEELFDLLKQISSLLEEDILENIIYWNKAENLKECYRNNVRNNIKGNKLTFNKKELFEIIYKMQKKVNDGIYKSKTIYDGLYPTYFTYDVEKYNLLEDGSIEVLEFKQEVLPLFLEGNVRAMKIISNEDKREIYDKIKKSNVYDNKLKMYKTSESISNSSYKIGRVRAFTPGWLENESIFMHMEYKYILEMIKSNNLLDDFYSDIKTIMPPYLEYDVYGRPLTENSSFIVSSVNQNEKIHGKGFSARLSGSTAEFLSIWKYMFLGDRLFRFENGKLKLLFAPKLHKDMFNEDGIVSFKLFSEIDVTYINKTKKSTYGDNGATVGKILVTLKDGEIIETESYIEGKLAEDIRNVKVSKIEVHLV